MEQSNGVRLISITREPRHVMRHRALQNPDSSCSTRPASVEGVTTHKTIKVNVLLHPSTVYSPAVRSYRRRRAEFCHWFP